MSGRRSSPLDVDVVDACAKKSYENGPEIAAGVTPFLTHLGACWYGAAKRSYGKADLSKKLRSKVDNPGDPCTRRPT